MMAVSAIFTLPRSNFLLILNKFAVGTFLNDMFRKFQEESNLIFIVIFKKGRM